LRILWPLAVLQLLLWGGAALFFYRSVQLDSAEQFVWAVSLENGYWKHPPLPSWMMHALVQLFGPSVALPVVATQCAMLCALLILYQLGAKMMSPQRAMLGVLLTSLISYFNLSADSFNHTTILAPFIAACLLSFHSALRRGGWHRWALAGLCAGLAMLVKYLALLHLVAIGIYVLVDRTHHRRQVAWGFLLASTTALVVLLPHFLWLGTHDFLPLRYAREVTQASSRGSDLLFSVCAFLAIQGLRLAPMLLVAWLLMRSGDGRASQTGSGAAPARGDRMFLWVAGTGPLVMEILIALATGAELQTRWGGTAFLAAGLLMASYLPARIETNTIRRSLWTASAVQLVLCVASTVSQTVVAPQIKRASRLSFPGDVLAREAMKTWSLHTHAPLRLVVSDIWLGGNLIAHTGERNLAVLVDGRRFKSPWVRQDALSACGALVLDQLSDGHGATEEPDPALQAMFKQAVDTGIWELPWDSPAAPGSSPRGMVRWGVILPAHDQGCLNASK
jgi:hypothetical protein